MSARLADGLIAGDDGRARCWLVQRRRRLSPTTTRSGGGRSRDDRRLFEKICLEGFQAGLSWLTILAQARRVSARPSTTSTSLGSRAFDGRARRAPARRRGDRPPSRQDRVGGRTTLAGPPISSTRRARSRATSGARAGTARPAEAARRARRWRAHQTADVGWRSAATSRRRGWTFVGPTTCYAFMQAMGLVNDHLEGRRARAAVRARARAATGRRWPAASPRRGSRPAPPRRARASAR